MQRQPATVGHWSQGCRIQSVEEVGRYLVTVSSKFNFWICKELSGYWARVLLSHVKNSKRPYYARFLSSCMHHCFSVGFNRQSSLLMREKTRPTRTLLDWLLQELEKSGLRSSPKMWVGPSKLGPLKNVWRKNKSGHFSCDSWRGALHVPGVGGLVKLSKFYYNDSILELRKISFGSVRSEMGLGQICWVGRASLLCAGNEVRRLSHSDKKCNTLVQPCCARMKDVVISGCAWRANVKAGRDYLK